jgi:fumarate hydratase class II
MNPSRHNAARGHRAEIKRIKPGQILLLAHREDLSLKDAALKLGYLTAEQFDKGCGPRT